MKRFFFIILVFLAWLLLSPSMGLSQDNEDIKTINTEGTSVIINDDLASARNKAIQDALQKAVEQVVITLIPEKTISSQSQIIRDNLYAKTTEYIHDYKILSERQYQAAYQVNIRATLFSGSIRDDLQSLGILTPENRQIPITVVFVTVRGLKSYSDFAKVKEVLKNKMKAVANIYQRRFEWGAVRLDLEIRGTVQSFAGEVLKTGHFSLDKTRTDQNYMELTFLR
ncbi:MAG TPA: flagellar assembly protein T N-terminal domain-containing protein [Syntrophales bacterium]|nr:flagellar assembly protein T N-terminal domain-containing protein [Syntrophales bacterium]